MKGAELIDLYRMTNQFGREIEMDYFVNADGIMINRLEIKEKHLATPNVSHGGVIAALADSTLGLAALNESAENGNLVSTVEFKINYLRPAKLHDVIMGIPRVRKIGQKIIFVEADFVNQKEELIATASGTFNQYPVSKVF